MRSSCARWRLLLLGALCTLCAVTGFAGPAAALQLDDTTDTSLTLDSDAHWFNGAIPVSNGTYQWWAYWDAPDATTGVIYLKVTRRTLATDALQTIRFDGTGGFADQHLDQINDGHNTVAFGIDKNDGTFHISFSNHALPEHYGQSSTSCLTQTNLSSCTFTWSDHTAFAPTEASTFTYPHFFNDREGHLYLGYRHGTSRYGDLYLNTYNDTTHTWAQVNNDGMVLWGSPGAGQASYDTDGAGPAGSASGRSTYIIGWGFDKNDRLNLMWTWREDVPYEWGVRYHDIYYAYSTDFGVNWKDNGGNVIATTGSDPIMVSDTTTIAVNLPGGYWPTPTSLAIDSNNQPHTVMPTSDVQTTDPLANNQRQTHFWRTSDNAWHSGWVESAGLGSLSPTWGAMFFDRADNIYMVYGTANLKWAPYNNLGDYNQIELPNDRVTWQDDGTQKYLDIQPFSARTEIDNWDPIGIPITTSAGANNNRKIAVRMKNNTVGTTFRVDWSTQASQKYDAAKSQTLTGVSTDGAWHTYTFTVTDADWTGTLRSLHIYPAGDGDVHASGKSIQIDYIRIQDDQSTPNVAKAWEFNSAGITMQAAEASQADGWDTWTIGALMPGLADSWNDGLWTIDTQRYADAKVVDFPMVEQGAPGTEREVIHSYDITGDDVYRDWRFDQDAQGWTATNHVSGFGWGNDSGTKGLAGTLTGNDSRLMSADNLSEPLTWAGTLATKVVVRLKNTSASTSAHLYFTTDADTSWNEAKSATKTITANSSYTSYTFDFTGNANWTGTLHRLRLDPSDDATTSGSFKVDRIYITP